MEALYTLEEKICKQLDEYAQEKRLSGSSVEAVHILTDTLKNIYKIKMIHECGYSEDGYSHDGAWRANMEGNYGHGSSFARRRDSMSRYSGDDRGGHSNRSYNGYSGDMGRMLQKLKGMLNDAGNDKERRIIEEAIRELENG